MVKKSTKANENSTQTNVTRIQAKDSKKPSTKTPSKSAQLLVNGEQSEPKQNVLKKFLGYFKGAWYELRQVRWPNRRATFGMTAALLIFTGVFAAFILIVDLAWENLFKLIIG